MTIPILTPSRRRESLINPYTMSPTSSSSMDSFRRRRGCVGTLNDKKALMLKPAIVESLKSKHKRTWEEKRNILRTIGSFHVLVVDDNKDQAELVSNFLTSFDGVTTEVANNGEVAVRMVKEKLEDGQMYHLILTDIWMPYNGYETTSDIRRLEKDRNTFPTNYIIGITAEGISSRTDVKARECGMDETITKPLKKDYIEKVISKRNHDLQIAYSTNIIKVAQSS